MMSSHEVEVALMECRGALSVGALVALPDDGGNLIREFMEQFRTDFEREIDSHPGQWAHDRMHILSLATAIGATAAFLATRERKPVGRSHLMHAYDLLKPFCEPVRGDTSSGQEHTKGRYCTGIKRSEQ